MVLSADSSVFGVAQQTGKGTPNVTDADFKYILFTEGVPTPQNITRALDREVGAGALPQGSVKVGVLSGAQMQFIPRPQTLGELLYAQLGAVSTEDNTTYSTHTFTLPTDQFSQPYYTLRTGMANTWGEQYDDNKLASLALRWRGADFMRGAFAFQGGLPQKVASMAAWAPQTYIDEGPQFLSPVSSIEVPTSTSIKVLEGAITMGSAVPLDEQWIVGSYYPDDTPTVNRAIGLTMTVLIEDNTLYQKLMYDPTGGADWTADIFREADIALSFVSDQEVDTGVPYSLLFEANGQNAASGDSNIQWSVQPVAIQAGRQMKMIISGIFTASPTVDEPITVTLVNGEASY